MKPGQYLDEFEIIRRLGTGGFGTVYLAHDTSLNRHVAIKELHALSAADHVSVKRFLQEARTAGNLNHPHIVTVYALKSKGDNHYLVLEYVPGGSVRDRLNLEGRLPLEEAIQIAVEVCDALAAVHVKGIIHRDIKPENILLSEDGRVKVSDFGIAHVPRTAGGASLTNTGFQPGTVMYMSPEQIRGEEPSAKSDVYQVAIVLYEMLTGRHYFDADALLNQAMRELNATNPLAPAVQARWMVLVDEKICGRESLGRGIPGELGALIDRAMLHPWLMNSMSARQFGNALSTLNPNVAQPRYLEQGGVDAIWGKGHDADVLAILSHAIKVDPYNAQTWAVRGFELAQQGYYDQAIAHYSRAIELNPNDTWAWYGRGEAYKYKGDWTNDDENALAIADYTRALEVDPMNTDAWLERANLYKRKRNFDQAISDYTHALEVDPSNADGWRDRGDVYNEKGDYERAITDYDRAIELNPRDGWAWSGRGDTYKEKGDDDQAIADYSQALELGPLYYSAWSRRGDAYLRKSDYDKAIADFTCASDNETGRFKAFPLRRRGDAYREKGDYDQAITDYTHALELSPKNALTWLGRGDAFRMKGKYDHAIADYTQSLELQPDKSLAQSRLEEIHKLSRRKKNRLIFKQPLSDNPEVSLSEGEESSATSEYTYAVILVASAIFAASDPTVPLTSRMIKIKEIIGTAPSEIFQASSTKLGSAMLKIEKAYQLLADHTEHFTLEEQLMYNILDEAVRKLGLIHKE